jgi:hypothetical protein
LGGSNAARFFALFQAISHVAQAGFFESAIPKRSEESAPLTS